ncbi:MAG: CSLREA domain-containing protein, partial [Gammaproteobacteria bacterium]|nr:CSLREA domain-containing protein [Gammaproteobacteria bacterium]
MGFLTGTRCSRPARQRLPVRSDDTRGRAVFHCLQLGLLAALLCGANVASAGTAPPLIVTTTIDKNDGICSADCSLREAIGTANVRAGTDTIIMASGDYVLSGVLGDLEFAGNVVLDGSAGNVEINGSALPRIVQLERGVSAEIHGAELIGRVVDFIGTGTGGQLLLSGATVRVIGETVTGDITYREGAGGIEVAIDSATLALALNEGQPDTVGVRLANARGAAVEIGAGMAGVISGNASLEGTAATLSGPLEYRYNDTDTAIDTTVATAFGDVAVAVPEFVRDVSGTTIAIGLVDAPQLSANLHFEFTDL